MSCSSSNSSSLLVHIAENGHSFEVDCDEATRVEAVMRFIESVSHVDMNDQLVLCLDMKLDPHRSLSAYKLPSHDDSHDLFIFNKARLQPNSPPPPLEHLDHHVLDVADPLLPSSPSQPRNALNDAADPALKALPSYEREFRVHYHKGHVIYSRTQLKYDHCERLLREQKVQQRAIEVAKGNLDQYYRMINQNYAEFMKRYAHQYRIHSDILANLGRDLEKLRSIKLHPALQSVNRKCLSDFVKDETVRNDGETCTHSHKQFENKVSQFNKMFSEVKQKVEELFVSTASLPIKNLELTIKEHQRYLSEQKSIMQSLRLASFRI